MPLGLVNGSDDDRRDDASVASDDRGTDVIDALSGASAASALADKCADVRDHQARKSRR